MSHAGRGTPASLPEGRVTIISRWLTTSLAAGLWLLLLLACGPAGLATDAPQGNPVGRSPSDRVPPTTEVHAATATVVAPSLRQPARVVRVVDGDTIRVTIAGQTYRVRYIGINAPEMGDDLHPPQPFAAEATARNAELVAGRTVMLEKDVSETDRYGRLLRYVWVDDVMINAELVRQGYARASSYPPDVKYQEQILRAEQEARSTGRGLWGRDE